MPDVGKQHKNLITRDEERRSHTYLSFFILIKDFIKMDYKKTIDKLRHGLTTIENIINEKPFIASYLNIQNENIEDSPVPTEF